MVDDPQFLREPVPPLTECIPALEAALHDRHVRLQEEQRHWRLHLDLPAELQWIAVEQCLLSNQLQDAWMRAFVIRSLRDLVPPDEYGHVLQ